MRNGLNVVDRGQAAGNVGGMRRGRSKSWKEAFLSGMIWHKASMAVRFIRNARLVFSQIDIMANNVEFLNRGGRAIMPTRKDQVMASKSNAE